MLPVDKEIVTVPVGPLLDVEFPVGKGAVVNVVVTDNVT